MKRASQLTLDTLAEIPRTWIERSSNTSDGRSYGRHQRVSRNQTHRRNGRSARPQWVKQGTLSNSRLSGILITATRKRHGTCHAAILVTTDVIRLPLSTSQPMDSSIVPKTFLCYSRNANRQCKARETIFKSNIPQTSL